MRNEKHLIIDGMPVMALDVLHEHIDGLMAEVTNDKVRNKKLCDVRKAIHLLGVFSDAVSERGLPFDWIFAKDRLPDEGEDKSNKVIAISTEFRTYIVAATCVNRYPENFLYWYPIPPSPWKIDERLVQEKI